MNPKEFRGNTPLSLSVNDDNAKYGQNMAIKTKSYHETEANSMVKMDTTTVRPCAIIGPDRVQPPNPSDVYLKKASVEPWPCPENIYRQPPDYPNKLLDYQPNRNISPRQTFQENMQRIMVPPSYSSIKNSDESSLKNKKLSMPPEAKYCDVPYNTTSVTNEHKSARNSDIPMSSVNAAFTRSTPHYGWPAEATVRPQRPYGAPEFYQYPEYPSCVGPRSTTMLHQHRLHSDEAQAYSERLYQEANIRFKPYPLSKEKHQQVRYDYNINNYPNFNPPVSFPPHKFDLPKHIHNQSYPVYPQLPLKFLDRRVHDSYVDGYQRSAPHVNFNPSFHNQMLHPPYGPVSGNCVQNKAVNKSPYDTNNKIYLDLDTARNKGYPVPVSGFHNEMNPHMQNDILLSNHPSVNMHSIPKHRLYRRENMHLKHYDYSPHYRSLDPSINMNYSLTRLPLQYSPTSIAISPTDSNTSNDTIHTLGTSQEDCGYVSQSSTTSVRSFEMGNYTIPKDMYRRYDYRVHPMSRNVTHLNGTDATCKNKTSSSNKKNINVREFLQMWNEGEEETNENNKEVTQTQPKHFSSPPESNNNQEQLYVLDLVNVPNEDLSKYEHIQKISKLPENIKGYNNIEILNQYEELLESPNVIKNKMTPKFNKEPYSLPKRLSDKENTSLTRPVSPLDVEAKISQSVIHKEVGCNFEIKPCSPEMLNVEMATPIQSILGERIIEKVVNPISTKSPILLRNVDNNLSGNNISCDLVNKQYNNSNYPNIIRNENYSVQDFESSSGLCLASLPRLDNDIELNFPEINQQFIKANQIEDKPQADLSQDHNKNSFINRNTFSPQFLPINGPEKEVSKLSKYRKCKKYDLISNEDIQENNNVIIAQQRIDSVIIKNPDTIRLQEDITSLNSKKTLRDDTSSNGYEIHHCSGKIVDSVSEENKILSFETAIDFSLSKIDENSSYEYINKNVKSSLCDNHCLTNAEVSLLDSNTMNKDSVKQKEMEVCMNFDLNAETELDDSSIISLKLPENDSDYSITNIITNKSTEENISNNFNKITQEEFNNNEGIISLVMKEKKALSNNVIDNDLKVNEVMKCKTFLSPTYNTNIETDTINKSFIQQNKIDEKEMDVTSKSDVMLIEDIILLEKNKINYTSELDEKEVRFKNKNQTDVIIEQMDVRSNSDLMLPKDEIILEKIKINDTRKLNEKDEGYKNENQTNVANEDMDVKSNSNKMLIKDDILLQKNKMLETVDLDEEDRVCKNGNYTDIIKEEIEVESKSDIIIKDESTLQKNETHDTTELNEKEISYNNENQTDITKEEIDVQSKSVVMLIKDEILLQKNSIHYTSELNENEIGNGNENQTDMTIQEMDVELKSDEMLIKDETILPKNNLHDKAEKDDKEIGYTNKNHIDIIKEEMDVKSKSDVLLIQDERPLQENENQTVITNEEKDVETKSDVMLIKDETLLQKNKIHDKAELDDKEIGYTNKSHTDIIREEIDFESKSDVMLIKDKILLQKNKVRDTSETNEKETDCINENLTHIPKAEKVVDSKSIFENKELLSTIKTFMLDEETKEDLSKTNIALPDLSFYKINNPPETNNEMSIKEIECKIEKPTETGKLTTMSDDIYFKSNVIVGDKELSFESNIVLNKSNNKHDSGFDIHEIEVENRERIKDKTIYDKTEIDTIEVNNEAQNNLHEIVKDNFTECDNTVRTKLDENNIKVIQGEIEEEKEIEIDQRVIEVKDDTLIDKDNNNEKPIIDYNNKTEEILFYAVNSSREATDTINEPDKMYKQDNEDKNRDYRITESKDNMNIIVGTELSNVNNIDAKKIQDIKPHENNEIVTEAQDKNCVDINKEKTEKDLEKINILNLHNNELANQNCNNNNQNIEKVAEVSYTKDQQQNKDIEVLVNDFNTEHENNIFKLNNKLLKSSSTISQLDKGIDIESEVIFKPVEFCTDVTKDNINFNPDKNVGTMISYYKDNLFKSEPEITPKLIRSKEGENRGRHISFKKMLFSPWMQKLFLFNEGICGGKHQSTDIKQNNFNETHIETLTINKHIFKEKEQILKVDQKCDAKNSMLNVTQRCMDNLVSKPYNNKEIVQGCNYLQEDFKLCSETKEEENVPKSPEKSSVLRRYGLKRSLSESALEDCNEDFKHLGTNKRKKGNHNIIQPTISEDLCNMIQNNRRNSISSIYNEENVYILIDNDFIITEESDVSDKIYYTEITDVCEPNSEQNDSAFLDTTYTSINESIADNLSIITGQNKNSSSLQGIEELVQETWVEDVACIETVVSDDIIEDIDEVMSPTNCKTDADIVVDQSIIYCDKKHLDKIKDMYGSNMGSNNTEILETLYMTPQMNVNKALNDIESHNLIEQQGKNCINNLTENNSFLNKLENEILSYSNSEIINEKENVNEGDTNFTNIPTKEYMEDSVFHISNEKAVDKEIVHSIKSDKNSFYQSPITANLNYSISSSPEVSSTTSEEKNSSILLKITNYNGSIVSEVSDIGVNVDRISYKLTEKDDYQNYNCKFRSSRTLITKAAQKYIPPLKDTIGDLKIKLALPQHRLRSLKQLKMSKVEPKAEEKFTKFMDRKLKYDKPIKQKPKFEDVLKSIDEIQFKKHKDKIKKGKIVVPKVVIKKNENGAHYASSEATDSSTSNKESYNPDLSGRKWQPWVFLEKNSFIDKMAIKNKEKAVYCHRKNSYVLAEKFRKYKSIYNANFVITQPSSDSASTGNLKYTIRLKHK